MPDMSNDKPRALNPAEASLMMFAPKRAIEESSASELVAAVAAEVQRLEKRSAKYNALLVKLGRLLEIQPPRYVSMSHLYEPEEADVLAKLKERLK